MQVRQSHGDGQGKESQGPAVRGVQSRLHYLSASELRLCRQVPRRLQQHVGLKHMGLSVDAGVNIFELDISGMEVW